jgi:hypothetical protein
MNYLPPINLYTYYLLFNYNQLNNLFEEELTIKEHEDE